MPGQQECKVGGSIAGAGSSVSVCAQAEQAALQQQLASQEAELAAAGQEGGKLAAQRQDLERQCAKVDQATRVRMAVCMLRPLLAGACL